MAHFSCPPLLPAPPYITGKSIRRKERKIKTHKADLLNRVQHLTDLICGLAEKHCSLKVFFLYLVFCFYKHCIVQLYFCVLIRVEDFVVFFFLL